MAEAGFDEKLRAFVRARRREPGRIFGELARGALAGLAGGRAAPRVDDRTPQIDALNKQYEVLGALEGAAGGDPAKVAKAKLDFLAKMTSEARQRLNKKASVYSDAQYRRAKLHLDTNDKLIVRSREALNALEPSRRGGSGGAGDVNTEKVNTTFYRALNQLSSSSTDTSPTDTIRATIASARLNPAEREELERRLVDSKEVSLPAAKRLEAIGGEEQQSPEEFISELMRPFEQDDAVAAQVINSPDPAAALNSIPDDQLRQRIKEMHFVLGEDGNPKVDLATGKSMLREDARMAAEQYTTLQGITESLGDVQANIDRMVTGSSGGQFSGEMKEILASYGVGSTEELFAKYGLDTASMQGREDALRGKYGGERADVASEIRKLSVAPKAPVARAAFEVLQDPNFSSEMQTRGFSDKLSGVRAMAREMGGQMRAERKETRGAARARLARPRVIGALQRSLDARRGLAARHGPQEVPE